MMRLLFLLAAFEQVPVSVFFPLFHEYHPDPFPPLSDLTPAALCFSSQALFSSLQQSMTVRGLPPSRLTNNPRPFFPIPIDTRTPSHNVFTYTVPPNLPAQRTLSLAFWFLQIPQFSSSANSPPEPRVSAPPTSKCSSQTTFCTARNSWYSL